MCSRWGQCSSLWGRRGSRPTRRSVQLDGGSYGIWGTTWGAGRCSHRYKSPQWLQPAQYQRRKKRSGGFWGWPVTIGGSLWPSQSWPAPWLTWPKRVPQIRSSGWSVWEDTTSPLWGATLVYFELFSPFHPADQCLEQWAGSWCCLRRWRESTAPYCTLAGSWLSGRWTTVRWKRSASPYGGQSVPSATTSWGAHLPSGQTMPCSSGSTTWKMPMPPNKRTIYQLETPASCLLSFLPSECEWWGSQWI